MSEHICFKRRRTLSMETLKPESPIHMDEIMNDFNNITVDNSNTKLLKQILDKLNKIEIGIQKLEKKVDKIFSEKDYIIENLKDEIYYFKDEMKDLKNNMDSSKNNDYFC